ncbi:hypothetical protein ACFYY8_40635 [Streptosporangium sp. NPDC001559]|uniref:hypothetical protein n=1 Tax=Streptosporangium sp. NPDC001559 TaxID=3366187 RepID=UPI0036DFC467
MSFMRMAAVVIGAAGLLAATPGIANAANDPDTASTVKEGAASAGTPGFVSAADEPSVVSFGNEWFTSNERPQDKGYGFVGYAQSTVGGVWQHVMMWRDNNYVVLESFINDEATDGYCAGAEIRYQVYTGSGWSGYHYRMIPSYDCSTNNDAVNGRYYYSYLKTRNVSSRACHVNSSGGKIECEGSWHGPI